LASVASYSGELERAKTLHLESLALRRKVGDKRQMAMSLNSLGEVERARKDYAAARVSYEESLQLAREVGDTRGIANTTGNLAYVALHEGDHERAATLFREGLSSAKQPLYKLGIAGYLAGLGGVAVLQEEHARAARLFGATRKLLKLLGASLAPPDRIQYDRSIEAARAALDQVVFAKAFAEGEAMTLDQAIEYALGGEP
jgi:tetratricopeptide (TPR) repeat protein